jgi:hypothetical protein
LSANTRKAASINLARVSARRLVTRGSEPPDRGGRRGRTADVGTVIFTTFHTLPNLMH